MGPVFLCFFQQFPNFCVQIYGLGLGLGLVRFYQGCRIGGKISDRSKISDYQPLNIKGMKFNC